MPPSSLSRAVRRTSANFFCTDPLPLPLSQDQSYFLASVGADALASAAFPLGALSKKQVRAAALAAGLPSADKRSSRGICFVSC